MTEKYRKGVGIVLMNRDKKFFIAKRIDIPDAWQMPQGGVDEGENPEDAVFREMEEEIGTKNAKIIGKTTDFIQYDFPAHIKPLNGKFWGQKQKWFLMKFLGEDDEINLETEIPEFTEWKWAETQDILDLIVDFKRPVYQKVFDELL